MNTLSKLALAALMSGGAAITASPSFANGEAVRNTPPHGEEARPCRFFVHRHLPAPHHCYRYYSNMYGPDVYVHDDRVFRDREAFLRWHEGHAVRVGRLAGREDRTADREDRRAEREDRYAQHEDRYAEREHEHVAAPDDEQQPSYDEEREEASGGAARGPGSADETSGGASRGERAEQSASGGASRGERIQQHASGGASGY